MTTRTRFLPLLLAACLWLAPAALPQGKSHPKAEAPKPEVHPNFTGEWIMNAEKSAWGQMSAPDSMRYVIRHNGATLVLTSIQDSVTTRLEMTTDGQERMTEESQDSEIWARVYWAGKVLVWEGRRKAKPARQVDPVSWISRWSLSEDGKVLTIQRKVTVLQGTIEQSIILEKK